MCLEALLGDENQEISYRLRMRAARLLSTLGFNPNKIMRDLSLAYLIRSTHVHGTENKTIAKKLKNIAQNVHTAKEILLLRIQEYTRIVFLIVLLYNKQKRELINFLTMAQINTSSLKTFEQKINLMKNYLNVAQISKWQDDQHLLKIFDETAHT